MNLVSIFKIVTYRFILKLFNYLGYKIIATSKFNNLFKRHLVKTVLYYGIISDKTEFYNFLDSINISQSQSQFAQDLFALVMHNYKRNGYFVEFGALDGLKGSNTLLLESLGWDGVLAEPSNEFASVKKTRQVKSYNLALYSESNLELEFIESGGISTLLPFRNSDFHNRKGKIYKVRTITLYDLLRKAGAPSYIDYISVDTEGSEYEILKDFPFMKYRFGVITIEHNFVDEKREKIHNLLSKYDYVRVLSDKTEVDDWYINSSIYSENKRMFK